MRAPTPGDRDQRTPQAVSDVLRRADALDQRRLQQIENQKASITRLLKDPSHASEIARLSMDLAAVQVALREAEARVRELEGGGLA